MTAMLRVEPHVVGSNLADLRGSVRLPGGEGDRHQPAAKKTACTGTAASLRRPRRQPAGGTYRKLVRRTAAAPNKRTAKTMRRHVCRPPGARIRRRERGGAVASRGTKLRRRSWTAILGSGVDGISFTVHPLGHPRRSIRRVRLRFGRVGG